ncbi:hypothetical protein PRIPAC_73778 [Pristionchus pacificus]|uniref:Uncharacterized protein n=1 Tax=Pristionchus pacificus TaxID=54126 RepID=A0A2A6C6B5_PRIPA|nr:hypothetical protein PRIPAC_73778 [Pristionchus pacificus]|eukprot:PDM73752.1 hypothetical protein PRIPAC_41108 [Pristionchus pacificus]
MDQARVPYPIESTVLQFAVYGSAEDYSATRDSLRSPSNSTSPYPKMLLIQVGGEEFIDVRAVVASKELIDITACYLLITPSSLIIHNGRGSIDWMSSWLRDNGGMSNSCCKDNRWRSRKGI